MLLDLQRKKEELVAFIVLLRNYKNFYYSKKIKIKEGIKGENYNNTSTIFLLIYATFCC